MGHLGHTGLCRHTPTECLPVARTKGRTIVLQLLDLLTVFSLADFFSAVPDILVWED